MEFDLAALAPLDRYKLLTGLVVPRPIAFVSSISADGTHNAAPFSFFNMFGVSPAVVVLGINVRSGKPKDSFANIAAMKEFVVNIATADIADKLNEASGDYGPEIDEFERAGLTPLASVKVRPPRIAEAAASVECRLMEVVQLDEGPARLIIGEMIYAHVRDGIVTDGKVDASKLDAIGRMGGPVYNYTRETFAMDRPVV